MKRIFTLVAIAIVALASCSPESRLIGSYDLESVVLNNVETGETLTHTKEDLAKAKITGSISFTDGGKFIVTVSETIREFDFSAKKDQLDIVVKENKTVNVRYSIDGNILKIFGKGEFMMTVIDEDESSEYPDMTTEFTFIKK